MARRRRSSARQNGEHSMHESDSDAQDEGKKNSESEDKCPACTLENADADKVSWIKCEACKQWYHWTCAGNGADVETIDHWYCTPCITAEPRRQITFKGPARKSARRRNHPDYAGIDGSPNPDASRWLRKFEGKPVKPDRFKRMKGKDVNLDWVEGDESAMTEPIAVLDPEGLEMEMPPDDFTVDDIAQLVGDETPVEVMDVASQSGSPGWTMAKWAEYFNKPASERDKIRNVISLEISQTKLGERIVPPRLVRELDWVENFWPATRKGKGHSYPKVQLYCLMGVANAWTDWHIDFAGSSVYYHVLSGAKVFYFIRPTPDNLAAYEKWSGSALQTSTWLGDLVDEVVKITLTAGNTMIIPSGWIHAVHTPVDTIVFGGNFLHSYSVPMQLRIRDIEVATRVPKKFTFPYFSRLCWYVGEKYLRDLKTPNATQPSARELASILYLADFLVAQARLLERGGETAKKEVQQDIPSDRVKDAPALARELRWRLRLAAGEDSDDERSSTPHLNGHSHLKRKRIKSETPDEHARFRNFRPKIWGKVTEEQNVVETRQAKAARPGDEEAWMDRWVSWADGMEEDGAEEAQVQSKKDVVSRVRKTATGLERQRVERIYEAWTWPRT
ncbi:Clavaminate synthase-like protein [Schizophyllum commune Tattone D]|nr:Clavaminate synthase-like protein [Schizophyllum commune Tattone D]